MEISSDLRTPIEPTRTHEMQSLGRQPGTVKNTASLENLVSNHGASQGGVNQSPTEGARGTTTPPGPKEIEQMTQERLDADPAYLAAKERYETWKNLANDFNLIDSHTLYPGNKKVSLDDLKALSDDPFADAGAKAAAKRLLANMDVWNELAAGKQGYSDDVVGVNDIADFVAKLKSELKTITDDTRNAVRAENAPPPVAGSQSAATGTNQTGSTPGTPSVESQVPRPPPSTLPGMDGATENLAITGDYLQAQMMALAEEAAASPEKATINAQKIAMLQNKFQAVTNMMNQLTQMLSNMSKMWSDVAMNSIRNLK